MVKLIYCTKTWEGEWEQTLKLHPKADAIFPNNLVSLSELKKRFQGKVIPVENIDAEVQEFFDVHLGSEWKMTISELAAVWYAATKKYTHILWYSGDVIPPKKSWVRKGLSLLKDYPIVSPNHEDHYREYVDYELQRGLIDLEKTDFGHTDVAFSDQCYLAEVKTIAQINYNLDHSIKAIYPEHGGNDFERRVAQWLASTGKKRAVLKDFKYTHISNDLKRGNA